MFDIHGLFFFLLMGISRNYLFVVLCDVINDIRSDMLSDILCTVQLNTTETPLSHFVTFDKDEFCVPLFADSFS